MMTGSSSSTKIKERSCKYTNNDIERYVLADLAIKRA